MIDFFKNNQPISIIGLALYALLLNANLLLNPPLLPEAGGAPLARAIHVGLQQLASWHIYLPVVIFIIWVWLAALLIKRIYYQHQLMQHDGYLAAMAFILLAAMLNQHIYYTAPFLAIVPIALALSHFMANYPIAKMLHYFDTGFYIGIATLLYLPAAIFILWLFICLWSLSRLQVRNFLLSCIGWLVPLIILSTILFVFNRIYNEALVAATQWQEGIWEIPIKKAAFSKIIAIGAVLTGITTTGTHLLNKYATTAIAQFRIQAKVVIFFLAIALLLLLPLQSQVLSLSPIAIANIVVSYLLAFIWLKTQPKLLAEGIHISLLLVLLWVQYYQF